MAPKRTTAEAKKRKKKWIPIFATKEFNNQNIGETYLDEPEQAIGRRIKVNLMTLTRDSKKQNFNVFFKVVEVKNNQAQTEFYKYHMQVAQLKRITKKNKNKVDDSFIYTTKDNKKVTIKPIIITRTLTYKSTLSDIRKSTREFLVNYTKKVNSNQILKDIVSNNLQREIKGNARKVTPVVNCIIKSAIITD